MQQPVIVSKFRPDNFTPQEDSDALAYMLDTEFPEGIQKFVDDYFANKKIPAHTDGIHADGGDNK